MDCLPFTDANAKSDRISMHKNQTLIDSLNEA